MQECFVTASVGIAMYPRDGQTVADLLRNSDVAMYTAKGQGRNSSSIYRPQLAVRGREKLELESALHRAIERDSNSCCTISPRSTYAPGAWSGSRR